MLMGMFTSIIFWILQFVLKPKLGAALRGIIVGLGSVGFVGIVRMGFFQVWRPIGSVRHLKSVEEFNHGIHGRHGKG